MVETESLGERIHRMQVEDRNVTVEQISAATGLGELSVWPYYAGWALTEIERLRAENKRLDRDLDEVMAERDKAQDALSSAHAALGGDGEWACRTYETEPGRSGDLHKDVPVLAASLRAENAKLKDIMQSDLRYWDSPEEDDAA